jgi:hypothetical protein
VPSSKRKSTSSGRASPQVGEQLPFCFFELVGVSIIEDDNKAIFNKNFIFNK